jgi:uncharacterized delta-60 repeat protein
MSGNPFSGDDMLFDVAVQTDGKVIGAGVTNSSGSSTKLLRAYSPECETATPDANFGSGGLSQKPYSTEGNHPPGASHFFPTARSWSAEPTRMSVLSFAAARYNVDGTLDTSFDGDGRVTTPITNGGAAFDALVQPDGKLILGGFANNNSLPVVQLVRYNVDGSLDSSFGVGGISKPSLGGYDDKILSMALLSDGKILATGHSGQSVSDRDVVTTRFLANGTLDTSFGSPGRVHTSIWNQLGQGVQHTHADRRQDRRRRDHSKPKLPRGHRGRQVFKLGCTRYELRTRWRRKGRHPDELDDRE